VPVLKICFLRASLDGFGIKMVCCASSRAREDNCTMKYTIFTHSIGEQSEVSIFLLQSRVAQVLGFVIYLGWAIVFFLFSYDSTGAIMRVLVLCILVATCVGFIVSLRSLGKLIFNETGKGIFQSSDSARTSRFITQFLIGTISLCVTSLMYSISWPWWVEQVGYFQSLVIWVLTPFFVFDLSVALSLGEENV
jgi:hypothetical protein